MKKTLLTTALVLATALVANAQCFIKIASGEQHTVAIADDGTLWGWGSNNSGELGLGTSTNVHTPTQIGTDNNWYDVDCGGYHTIALKTTGDAFTWGFNDNGQCGTGGTTNVYSPYQVTFGTTREIAAGSRNSFIIRTDSTLHVCGQGTNGQFGNGSNSNFTFFTQVGTDNDWIEIASGHSHSLAIKGAQQLLYTTGTNSYGQLGSGNTTGSNTWTNYVTGAYEKLGAGTNYSMALTSTGALHVFGRNNYGQLGNGDNTFQLDVLVPTAFATTQSATGNIQDFSCGPDNVIVLNTAGSVYSWGRTHYNLSGLSMATHNWSPYYWNVSWGTPTAVAMGFFMAHVPTDEGTWSWGKNDRGQIGNGNFNDNTNPNANLAGCPTIVPCDISNIDITGLSACDPATNTYDVTIEVFYTDAPSSGTLIANGIGFSITASPQVITLTPSADGNTVDLDVHFSEEPTCNYTMTNAWTAPVNCESVGVDAIEYEVIALYPNPANTLLNIETKEVTYIRVVTLLGETVISTLLNPGKNTIDVGELSSGIYFVQTENGASTKFIKQ